MNRLQKKCLLASSALHGLLLVIVFVGPAFLARRPPPPSPPIITVIPDKLIDDALTRGGNPNGRLPVVQPPAPLPTPAPPAATPPAPAPQPKPVTPEPEPEPAPPAPRPAPPRKTTPEPIAEAVKPPTRDGVEKAGTPKIRVETRLVRRETGEGATSSKTPARSASQAQARAEAQARRQALARVESGLSGAAERLASNLTSGTSIEPFGPGGGGPVYANWFQQVMSIYDRAWRDPTQVPDGSATVKVRVKVARNGTVLEDAIVKRSGVRALDQSVQEALDRVRAGNLVPPLPEGAPESERTFTINFDLDSKRKLG